MISRRDDGRSRGTDRPLEDAGRGAGDRILPITSLIGIGLLWFSAILTLYTGWDYFRAGLRHLIDD